MQIKDGICTPPTAIFERRIIPQRAARQFQKPEPRAWLTREMAPGAKFAEPVWMHRGVAKTPPAP